MNILCRERCEISKNIIISSAAASEHTLLEYSQIIIGKWECTFCGLDYSGSLDNNYKW